jgi:hypothetical protein
MMVIITDHAGDVGCETKAKAGGAGHAQASLKAGTDKQWEARFPTIRFVLLFLIVTYVSNSLYERIYSKEPRTDDIGFVN